MMSRSHALCAILLALAACSSSNPRLHTLAPRPGPVRAGGPRVVAVRAFGVPRYLDRHELVSADGAEGVTASDDDWWAEPLRVMMRRVMIDDLAQRLPGAEVLAADGAIAAPADAEVLVDLRSFEWDGEGAATLIGDVAVQGPGRARTIDRLVIRAPGSGATAAGKVDALSAALGEAADVAAARVAP